MIVLLIVFSLGLGYGKIEGELYHQSYQHKQPCNRKALPPN